MKNATAAMGCGQPKEADLQNALLAMQPEK